MIGNWRWNVGLGLTGVILTILFSLGKNAVTVILLRSVYAFIAFVVIAFILRAVLTFILKPPALLDNGATDEDGVGTQLDLTTPDESEDLNQLLKDGLDTRPSQKEADSKQQLEQEQEPFRPLAPPQLVSAQKKEPEELAKVVRHLTGG
ncbi:hypothetical protein SAMN04487969_101436 [Paenibacillus algorifonticola]|uniref:Uncharacterized protein n=1 Tax=Paenibacillus algorifonticola TaxID=684063 RepID=A0A1I1YBF0_9BACL|nr:hypothetical protein [Paenibacillus algorifonticola]SFE16896.1 hypothetical protein SAMN04487969_101436 [Paenibacillus algorifonticola]